MRLYLSEYEKAIRLIFGPDIVIILCLFHFLQAIVPKLSAIEYGIDYPEQEEMLYQIRLLASLENEKEFFQMWRKISKQWKKKCSKFLDYFTSSWMNGRWLPTWTRWGRCSLPADIITAVQTNLLTERQFLYLKYTFLQKRVNRR